VTIARSETSTEQLAVDPLRLNFCPNCDYSREGLPDGAPCPECGMRCDSSFIVLQDDVGMPSEPAFRKYRRWTMTTLLILFCAYVIFKFAMRGKLVALVWFTPLALLLVVNAWRWLFAWRRAHAQLWLHELGLEIVRSTEEAQRAARLTYAVNIAFSPLIFVLLALMERDRDTRWILLINGFVWGGGMALVEYRRRRANPRIHIHAGDFQRRLIPWRAIVQFDMLRPTPGRAQLRFNHRVRLIGPLDHSVARLRIDVPCESATFDILQQRIRTWRDNATWAARG
jgi:hypothetical protein